MNVKSCDRCGVELKNNLFRSLCEDCWVTVSDQCRRERLMTDTEQRLGMSLTLPRDAMIAEVRPGLEP